MGVPPLDGFRSGNCQKWVMTGGTPILGTPHIKFDYPETTPRHSTNYQVHESNVRGLAGELATLLQKIYLTFCIIVFCWLHNNLPRIVVGLVLDNCNLKSPFWVGSWRLNTTHSSNGLNGCFVVKSQLFQEFNQENIGKLDRKSGLNNKFQPSQ